MRDEGRYLRLGDMLVHRGTLTVRKLQRGLKVSQESNQRLGDVLVELGYASEEEIAKCLAEQYGFAYEDLTSVHPNRTALEKLTPEFALKWGVLPLELTSRFTCVISDPLNVELSDTLAAIVRKPVSCSLAAKNSLRAAIRQAYGLPVIVLAKSGRKRPPQPESVLQRDRVLLLDAMNDEANESQRRAS